MNIYLDSSIDTTGYALSEGEGIIRSGVIKTKGQGMKRLQSLSVQLKEILGAKDYSMPTFALVEIPGTFSYSRLTSKRTGKGMSHIGLRSLNWAVGVLVLTLLEWGVEVETIEAHLWKGRRNKEFDMNIARNYIGRECIDSNEGDAVMLAVWHNHGRLKARRIA